MSERRCLRCKTVTLTEVGSLDEETTFFECQTCRRHYALRPGKQLTFRWLHPISLALYGVIFDETPSARSEETVESLVRHHSEEQLEEWVREVVLELEEPTQQVRDIIDCRAPERDLRAFLRLVAEGIEARLARRRSETRDASN